MPEQIDIINGLRPLVASVGHLCCKGVGAILPADGDIFRAQRYLHLVASFERLRHCRLRAAPLANVDHAEFAAARDQRAREFMPIRSSLPLRITPIRSPSTTASTWSWVT